MTCCNLCLVVQWPLWLKRKCPPQNEGKSKASLPIGSSTSPTCVVSLTNVISFKLSSKPKLILLVVETRLLPTSWWHKEDRKTEHYTMWQWIYCLTWNVRCSLLKRDTSDEFTAGWFWKLLDWNWMWVQWYRSGCSSIRRIFFLLYALETVGERRWARQTEPRAGALSS